MFINPVNSRGSISARRFLLLSFDESLGREHGRNLITETVRIGPTNSINRKIDRVLRLYSKKNWFGGTSEITIVGSMMEIDEGGDIEKRGIVEAGGIERNSYIYITVWIVGSRSVTGVNKRGKNAWNKYDNCILDERDEMLLSTSVNCCRMQKCIEWILNLSRIRSKNWKNQFVCSWSNRKISNKSEERERKREREMGITQGRSLRGIYYSRNFSTFTRDRPV